MGKRDSIKKQYLDSIIDCYYDLRYEDIPPSVIHQMRRSLLDYLGCAAYTAHHHACASLVKVILSLAKEGGVPLWGEEVTTNDASAAMANATRISHIELDDCSAMGASVHPGVYVWSAAFAAWSESHADARTVVRAVLFGYELVLRMGLLSTQQVRNLGLHGPGMNGAFAALAAGGMVEGLTRQQMKNAIGIAGSLLPVCPFVSFLDGTDSKDLYGGWGTYLGLFAVHCAKEGLTGPHDIIDGNKSLISLYNGSTSPYILGKDFLIDHISFKEFSACASVHPALSALLAIMARHPFHGGEVEHVLVETYPYSYQLNSGVGKVLNPSSARLSLPYTIAVTIEEGALSPAAFNPESLKKGRYQNLMRKVEVKNHTAYGDGAFGTRGSIVTVTLMDGTELSEESLGSRWSKGATDDQLLEKFRILSEGAFPDRDMVASLVWDFGGGTGLEPLVQVLRQIR